jgi:starch phosphorylase
MAMKPLTAEELTQMVAGLNKLARNLWWTWNQEAQEVFSELSPRGWQNLYHNAVAVLHEVSDYELRVRLQDPDFAERVRRLLQAFDSYLNEKNLWGYQTAPKLRENPVAYFSAEFGFHETLPIAAGGLGKEVHGLPAGAGPD